MTAALTRSRALALAALIVFAAVLFLLFRGNAARVAAGGRAEEPVATAGARGAAAAARPGAPGQGAGAVAVPSAQPGNSGRVFFKAGWGSGKDQLGHVKAEESNPQGPMALSVDRQGNVYVLDQVNGRISRFDKSGQLLSPLPVTQQAPRDLVVSPVGTVLVMDNLRDNSIAVLNLDGKLIGELPVSGKNLPEGGSASGLFADSSGVYVGNEKGMALRIGDAAGAIDQDRPLLDGRPSRDGSSLLSMALIQASAGRFWVRAVDRATGQMKFMREYTLATPILTLILLESDLAGRIYTAASVGRERPSDPAGGGGGWDEVSIQLLCLGPLGEVRNVLALPVSTVADESVRDLSVTQDGVIFYMHRTEQGVELLQYSCG